MRFEKGDLVEFDGRLAVVVRLGGEMGVAEGHLALWFGEENPKWTLEGGGKNEAPQLGPYRLSIAYRQKTQK